MRRLNFHIAARWSRRDEATHIASKLSQMGHGITSSWLQSVGPGGPDLAVNFGEMTARRMRGEPIDLNKAADEQTVHLAAQAIEDVDRCDALVLLTGASPGRHNLRLFQAGYALGRGKRVYFLGLPGENLASMHPRVIFLPGLKELINDLHSRNECPCKEPHHARPRGHQPEGMAQMRSAEEALKGSAMRPMTLEEMAAEIERLKQKAGE